MPLSHEAVLLSCQPSIITLLREKAGIDWSPDASTEDEVKALAEWCVEHSISPDEVSALAAAASREAAIRETEWCEGGEGSGGDLTDPDELDEYDVDHVSTYAELGPGCAAALAMLGHALATNTDNIDVVENAHTFLKAVAKELLAFRKAKQDAPPSEPAAPATSPINFADYANRVRCGAPLPPVPDEERQALRYFLALEAERDGRLMAFRKAAQELEAAPGDAAYPPPPLPLLQYLRAIPVTWTQEHGPNVCANAELLVYRADDNGQHLRVALDAAHTIHIRVSNGMGLDRTSTTHPDEVPYLIRGLIGSLAHRSLERLDGATVAAAVPPWAAEHVRRSMDERCDEYQRMKEEAQRRAWTQQDVERSEKRRSLKMLLAQPAEPQP